MKLEVGKTYRSEATGHIWHVAGRMDDGRLFGWSKRGENTCGPAWFEDELHGVEEYVPPRKFTGYINMIADGGGFGEYVFLHATDANRSSESSTALRRSALLEITYTEGPAGGPGTATVKVLP